MDKALQPYETAMGMIFWVLIFTFIIGYVYMKQQSFVAAAVAALIIISVIGNYLVGMEAWVNLMTVFIALVFTALFLYFISKRRN